MNSLMELTWTLGSAGFLVLFLWIALRLIRWAKKGSRGASMIGWGMGLPAAGANPIPPPQENIEEVAQDIESRRSSSSADSDR